MSPWRRRPGPALRGGPLPMVGVTVSLLGHAILLGALAFLAGLWNHSSPSKVYVVNLVAGLASPRPGPLQELKPQSPTPPDPLRTSPRSPREPSEPANLPALPVAAKPVTQPRRPTALARPEERKPQLPRPLTEPARSRELPSTALTRPQERQPQLPPRLAEPQRIRELPPTALARPEERQPQLPPRLAEPQRIRELPPTALARPEERKPPLPPAPAEPALPRELPHLAQRPEEKKQTSEHKAPPATSPLSASERASTPPEAQRAAARQRESPGTSAVSAEVSDFPFTWYLSRVQLKVAERWAEQPRISEPAKRPFIFVEILRDGSIKPPRLEKSSGNAFYDQAALRAITEASPFPPLPQEWSRPTLRILFGFELQPSRG